MSRGTREALPILFALSPTPSILGKRSPATGVTNFVAYNSHSQYTSDTDSTFKSDALNAEINRESGSSLSTADIVELFRNVVNKARDSMQETLVGSEKIDETIQLNLTIDLNRKSIDSFPEEVVQILKRDVERYNQANHFLAQAICWVWTHRIAM